MADYPFSINGTPFYASQAPTWKAYGVQPGFTSDGRPAPYGQGSFSVVLNAVAVSDPSAAGAPFSTSGTRKQLFTIWQNSLSAAGGVQTFVTYDPKTDAYITVTGMMDPPVQVAGGAAVAGVLINVRSAFISGGTRATYYGGDPAPITTTPSAYIPGDPLPAPVGGLTYGWNIGRWNFGLWNQGEGV